MATTAEDPPDAHGISPDPGDDYLVALARVTGHVLTPRAFLDRMERETRGL